MRTKEMIKDDILELLGEYRRHQELIIVCSIMVYKNEITAVCLDSENLSFPQFRLTVEDLKNNYIKVSGNVY